MSRKKKIVFPFDCRNDNTEAYIFTVELAKRTNAEIIMLSAYNEADRPGFQNGEKSEIYLHMLNLAGKYYSFFNDWKNKVRLDFMKVIRRGTLKQTLLETLQNEKVDVVVFHGDMRRNININELPHSRTAEVSNRNFFLHDAEHRSIELIYPR